METSGDHHDAGKPMVQLISPEWLLGIGEVLAYGDGKYPCGETDNWKGGIKCSRLFGSLLRHVYKHMSGETLDRESGLPHLHHAATNLMMIDWMLRNRPDLDDREKKLD